MGQDKVRAAVLRQFGQLRMEEFPYPAKLEPGSLIVKMLLAGICGTDKHIYDGKADVQLPLILGHENLARVEHLSTENPP
ncbi:alcohol dehydrogenase catalytic domain-containing protein, partial [Candidatus Bipolaricaulota bacterium]|nr:alcohol dehydrogenase catalytic domain-containing protein [Candidatus Bipolaricaulota bacterium]